MTTEEMEREREAAIAAHEKWIAFITDHDGPYVPLRDGPPPYERGGRHVVGLVSAMDYVGPDTCFESLPGGVLCLEEAGHPGAHRDPRTGTTWPPTTGAK